MIKTLKQYWRQLLLLILILLIVILLFLPKPQPSTTPSPSPLSLPETSPPAADYTPPFFTQPPLTVDQQPDTQAPSVQTAITAVNRLKPHLPIYIKDFPTSVNIPTTINIFHLNQDPDYLIHLDIYGIDYQTSTIDETINPHLTAFKESFQHARSQLEQLGVDLKDIYFIFGGKQYIQETAELWIQTFNLLD